MRPASRSDGASQYELATMDIIKSTISKKSTIQSVIFDPIPSTGTASTIIDPTARDITDGAISTGGVLVPGDYAKFFSL